MIDIRKYSLVAIYTNYGHKQSLSCLFFSINTVKRSLKEKMKKLISHTEEDVDSAGRVVAMVTEAKEVAVIVADSEVDTGEVVEVATGAEEVVVTIPMTTSTVAMMTHLRITGTRSMMLDLSHFLSPSLLYE